MRKQLHKENAPQGSLTPAVPRCIGIIMDGNRRWARARGLDSLEGHRKGYEIFKDTVKWAREAGVRALVCYAFSTENWHRSEEEVAYLMRLLEEALLEDMEEVIDEGVSFILLGQKERLSAPLQKKVKDLEQRSAHHRTFVLAPAISYGGRADILQAAARLIQEGGAVTEESFSRALWTAEIPDPDLIIRTGGERRLSNFLTWDGVYSELYFSDTLWPDFSHKEFGEILAWYATRERRRGR